MARPYIYAAATVALVGAVWWYGNTQYREGRKELLAEIEKARVASQEEKQEIDNEIDELDDDELLRRALEFVRQGSGR